MNKLFKSKTEQYWYLIRSSIIGGFLIGLGCIANLSVGCGILGATLFSLGLITVVIQSRWLYTGKIGYVNDFEDFWITFVALVFNLIGIGITTYLFVIYGNLQVDSLAIVQNKLSENWIEALVRSVGCGALMYIAVEGYKRTEKLIAVALPVIVFILCGFDHCIANYGYLTMKNIFWCNQLPIWVLGNSIGSFIVSKI